MRKTRVMKQTPSQAHSFAEQHGCGCPRRDSRNEPPSPQRRLTLDAATAVTQPPSAMHWHGNSRGAMPSVESSCLESPKIYFSDDKNTQGQR